jgi:hypothetical protein
MEEDEEVAAVTAAAEAAESEEEGEEEGEEGEEISKDQRLKKSRHGKIKRQAVPAGGIYKMPDTVAKADQVDGIASFDLLGLSRRKKVGGSKRKEASGGPKRPLSAKAKGDKERYKLEKEKVPLPPGSHPHTS